MPNVVPAQPVENAYPFRTGADGMANFAVLIIDMWDQHWCESATSRVAELAPRINDFITEARNRGALIIHAPSDCMGNYNDNAAHQRAQQLGSTGASPFVGRDYPPVPLIMNNGGCPETKVPPDTIVWKRENKGINIIDEPQDRARNGVRGDLVSEQIDQMYPAFQKRGCDSIILLGVHLNRCILWTRPFSLYYWVGLKNQGYLTGDVLFVRDLTDTMYKEDDPPYINHFAATDLVVRYIEERHRGVRGIYSSDLLGHTGTAPFRFMADNRPSHNWNQVTVRCLDESGNKRFITARKNGTVSLNDTALAASPVFGGEESSYWQVETLGPGLISLRADLPSGRFYLDGNPNGGPAGLQTTTFGHTGTAWYLESVGLPQAGPFTLHCCGPDGKLNLLQGFPASNDGQLQMCPTSASELPACRWVIG